VPIRRIKITRAFVTNNESHYLVVVTGYSGLYTAGFSLLLNPNGLPGKRIFHTIRLRRDRYSVYICVNGDQNVRLMFLRVFRFQTSQQLPPSLLYNRYGVFKDENTSGKKMIPRKAYCKYESRNTGKCLRCPPHTSR